MPPAAGTGRTERPHLVSDSAVGCVSLACSNDDRRSTSHAAADASSTTPLSPAMQYLAAQHKGTRRSRTFNAQAESQQSVGSGNSFLKSNFEWERLFPVV